MCADYSNKQFPGGGKGGHGGGSVEKGYGRASSAERAINIGTGSSAKGPILIPSHSDGVVSSYDFGPEPKPVQGPPWLFAYPLFDGDSYEVNKFFERRIFKFGEATKDQIILRDIGNSREYDPWYEQLRGEGLATRDEEDAEKYIEEIRKVRSEFHRLGEMRKLLKLLSVSPDDLPCIAFRTEPIWKPVSILPIERTWYSTPEAQHDFGKALLRWFSSFQVGKLLRDGMTNAELSKEIRTRLPEVASGIQFAVRAGEIRRKTSAVDAATKKSPRGFEPFSTPTNAEWTDVQIRFLDGHKVSVRVKENRGVFNYTQMGMANERNGEPTYQWDLLRSLADERGILTWESEHADRKLKKRKQLLGDKLKAFFGLDGDPFNLTKDRKGWKSRFMISPEDGSEEG